MQALVTSAIVIAIAAILALPALVAIIRRHQSWVAITVLTVALGWTGFGWIAALLWARGSTDRLQRRRLLRGDARKAKPARREAPGSASVRASANDNASAPVRVGTSDLVPEIVASDAYEDWLEQGQALQAMAHVERASAPSLAA